MKLRISHEPQDYHGAMTWMQDYTHHMAMNAHIPPCIWFLSHPPLYTAGRSAKACDLLKPLVPVIHTDRGGQYTYHGPGQLVVYVMVNLHHLCLDVRAYVRTLEGWIINVLQTYGVTAFADPTRIGVWVNDAPTSAKIAALGVRVSRGMTSHGFCLNYGVDLSYYQGIVPCGLGNSPVTSLDQLGIHISFSDLICAFQDTNPFQSA